VQPLETKRCLALSGPDTKRGSEDGIDVSVLHDQRATSKIGIEIELEAARKPAPQVWTQATEGERVDDLLVGIVEREPAVGVNQQADLQLIVPVGRLKDESGLCLRDRGRCQQARGAKADGHHS
jgi:hypothetical protein